MAKTKSTPKKEPSPEVIAKEIFDIFNKYHVQPEHGYELLTQLQCITEKEMIKSKKFNADVIERMRQDIRALFKMENPKLADDQEIDEDDSDGFETDEEGSSKESPYDAKSIKEPEGHSYG